MMVAHATGDALEVQDQVVDFERFGQQLERASGYADGAKGGIGRMTRYQVGLR